MKLCLFFCFVFAINVVIGQWANRVYLEEAENYFHEVLQKSMLELEKRGFCNLRLSDLHQNLNQQMYNWLVSGNVTYTNGFVVSIQKIDVTNIQQLTLSGANADGVVQTSASISGRLNLRDVKIGYDVIAELRENGDHRFTGTFVHTLISFSFRIQKNLEGQEITATGSLDSLTAGLDRMQYMPENNITQVISRAYTPNDIRSGVVAWSSDVILPIILDIAQNEIPYPPVCLDCR